VPVIKSRKPRHRMAGLTGLALASAVAVALLPGAAAAQVTPFHDNFSEPFEVTTFNPCTGEEILLSGTLSGTVTTFTQPSGQILVVSHQLLTAEGQGSEGNHYTISDTGNASILVAPDDPSILSQTLDSHVISQGDAPNFLQHTTNHVTINTNGVETVRIFDFSSECR
jgi:hypothetical protein